MKPFITVVLPVRNEALYIKDTLFQLLGQNYPRDRYEIIVADGMSEDSTREIVKNVALAHPQVRLLDNPKRLSSAGRNVGFKKGSGDLFLVVDGHCFIPERSLFNNVVDCFTESGADCLGRPQPLDPPGLTVFQQAVAMARASSLGHGGDSLIYSNYEGYCSPVSNGAAYRKEVFEKVGYVDEDFDAAEDVEFNYRIKLGGFECYTSPRLKICYYPRGSFKGLFRQMKRYGMGRYRFTRKHRQALSLNQLIPAGFTLGLMLLCVCGLWDIGLSISTGLFNNWSLVTILLSASYAFYIIIVIIETLRLAARKGCRYMLHLPLIFFTVHYGLGYGFLCEMLCVHGSDRRDIVDPVSEVSML